VQQPQRNALGLKRPKRHEGTGYSSNKRETIEKNKNDTKRDKEK